MAYTVKKLAAMSGVSVRTLHLYDGLGLLRPAYRAANGYRFYEEPQILMLQQILFYRELGFELKQIKRIIDQPSFDRIAALESHRRVLTKNLDRTQKLVETVDRTIEHLKGTKRMKNQEMFSGFSPEVQARYEHQLVERFGESAKGHIAQSKAKVKDWTKADWESSRTAFAEICQDLTQLMGQGLPEDSPSVQDIIRRHYRWLKRFWTPTRESYAGYAQLIVDSELRAAYETHHPKLPEFAAVAMKSFAQKELSASDNSSGGSPSTA
jgi:MerR family transcriptional regulator, thiopeptide resistance regulator